MYQLPTEIPSSQSLGLAEAPNKNKGKLQLQCDVSRSLTLLPIYPISKVPDLALGIINVGNTSFQVRNTRGEESETKFWIPFLGILPCTSESLKDFESINLQSTLRLHTWTRTARPGGLQDFVHAWVASHCFEVPKVWEGCYRMFNKIPWISEVFETHHQFSVLNPLFFGWNEQFF